MLKLYSFRPLSSIVIALLLTTAFLTGCNESKSDEYFRQGKAAYNLKDYKEAARLFSLAAEYDDHNSNAQYFLGKCFANGYGVEKDLKEAEKWFLKAAEQGDWNAQDALGFHYYESMNYSEAVKWFSKAAEQGHSEAQYELGVCYYVGNGVEKDLNEAVKWFRKSAEQGEGKAQAVLSYCYEHGRGVIEDKDEAAKWYHKAEEQLGPQEASDAIFWLPQADMQPD